LHPSFRRSCPARTVGARFVANTIGMQMSAAALGAAAVPGLVDILARQSSLEIIPMFLAVLIVGLLGLYRLSQKLLTVDLETHATPGRS
jgi:hypothetical protein